MWEIVISIFKGLGKSYSSEVLSLYKEIIIQSINHSNTEIATQTLSFLDDENNFDDKGQHIVQEIHKRIKPDKLPFKLNNAEKKIEDKEISEKQVKMAGSFLNKKSVIPKMILIKAKKENDEKRISMPDPETQVYSSFFLYIYIHCTYRILQNKFRMFYICLFRNMSILKQT